MNRSKSGTSTFQLGLAEGKQEVLQMSYRINTNVASLTAQRFLDKAQRQTNMSLKSLASGSRVGEGSKDAAGFAISENLRGQISGLKQAKLNAESAVAFIQTAEGSLNEQNNIILRMREIAVQAASDTVGGEERSLLDGEFQQLNQEFDRIAHATRYGDKRLLIGENEEFAFHVGTTAGKEDTITFKLNANTTSDEVGLEGLTITDQDDALESLEKLDKGMSEVMKARATFSAAQSRFQYAIDTLSSQHQNISEARSIIADVDVAGEMANLTKNNILEELSTSVLAQANQTPRLVQKLIG